MSAAANAAGYLYVHGQLPVSDTNAKAARPDRTAKPQAEPIEEKRTPKIEYRKRRPWAVPPVA